MNLDDLNRSQLVEKIHEQDRMINYFKFELDQLKRAVFGKKSERYIPASIPGQRHLFEDDVDTELDENVVHQTKKEEKKRGKRNANHSRKAIPEKFAREEEVIQPEVDTSEMKCIGQVVTEKYECKPVEIWVRKIIRPKYIDDQGKIYIGSYNDPFPKTNMGVTFLAHVAVNKYVNHLPLYRQCKMFKSDGATVARSTLSDGMMRTAQLLEILYDKMNEEVMGSAYIQADESSIPVLTKDKPGSTLKGCMLVKVAPKEKLVIFDYIKTKEKTNILESLKGFKGYLQVDGNVSYEELGRDPGIDLMHCLVHARRKFEAALDYDHNRCDYVLNKLKEVYLIERQIKGLSVKDKSSRRHVASLPMLKELKSWLEKEYRPNEPMNPFTTAVRYTLKRWDGLIMFTKDAPLRPDNNLIESQIRQLALGRKNFMFTGSHRGAHAAAIFYSFFATCQLNGVDPKAWLAKVINRISDHKINNLQELLPTADFTL